MIIAKTDNNQKECVTALRNVGASVALLHAVGRGVPDLLVGYRGQNWLVEVKSKSGKLTPAQVKWHGIWQGQISIVRNWSDALALILSH